MENSLHPVLESYDHKRSSNVNETIIGILDHMSKNTNNDPLLPFCDSKNTWREELKVPFSIGNLLSRKNVSLEVSGSERKKAKKINQQIEKDILNSQRHMRRQMQTFVIGSAQAGKTTFLKCGKLLDEELDDRKDYHLKIFYLCMSEILNIVEEMRMLNIELSPSTSSLVKQLITSNTKETKVLSEWIQQIAKCEDIVQYMTNYDSDHTRGHIRLFFLPQLEQLIRVEPSQEVVLRFPDSWYKYRPHKSSTRKLDFLSSLEASPRDFTAILPQDIMLDICALLDLKSLCSLTQVNKWLAAVCNNDNVWVHLLKRHFSAQSTSAMAKDMFMFLYTNKQDSKIIKEYKLKTHDRSIYCMDSKFFPLWRRKGIIDIEPTFIMILFDSTLAFHSKRNKFEKEVKHIVSMVDTLSNVSVEIVMNKIDLAEELWQSGKQSHIKIDNGDNSFHRSFENAMIDLFVVNRRNSVLRFSTCALSVQSFLRIVLSHSDLLLD